MPSKHTRVIRAYIKDIDPLELYAAEEGISLMEALSRKLNLTKKTPPIYNDDKGLWVCPFCLLEYQGKSQIITHFQEVELNK